MKFFSRKALVAGATAIAVSFAGVNVASAEGAPANPGVVQTETPEKPANNDFSSQLSSGSSKTDKVTDKETLDTEAIKSWIGIITAVVSALTAIYAFVNKISK